MFDFSKLTQRKKTPTFEIKTNYYRWWGFEETSGWKLHWKSGEKKITEKGINVLINATEFKKLRVLSLLGVAINDWNINELNTAKSLIANLRTLNLMKCRQISTLTPIFTKLLNKSNSFPFNFDWDFFINQFPHLIDHSILASLGEYKHNFIRNWLEYEFSHRLVYRTFLLLPKFPKISIKWFLLMLRERFRTQIIVEPFLFSQKHSPKFSNACDPANGMSQN